MNDTQKKYTEAEQRAIVKRLQRAVASGQASFEGIAEKVGRSPRTISEWVSGFRFPPSTAFAALEAALR